MNKSNEYDDEETMKVEVRMPDKYDDAMEYLFRHPEKIIDAWGDPEGYRGRGGELFGFVGPVWHSNDNKYDIRGEVKGSCGCLQQIRRAYKSEEVEYMSELEDTSMSLSFWPRQWARIAMDRRIPAEEDDIKAEHLPVFAEWQRKIDDLRRADGMEVPY